MLKWLMKSTENNIKDFEVKNLKKIKHDDFIFSVPKELLEFIKKIRTNECEKGGFLIGYKISNANQFTINKLSLPIKRDKANAIGFLISKKHHKIVKHKLKNWQENFIVIGIWHTHPSSNIEPSYTDLKLFKKNAKKTNQRFSLNSITGSKKTNFIVYDNYQKLVKNMFNMGV